MMPWTYPNLIRLASHHPKMSIHEHYDESRWRIICIFNRNCRVVLRLKMQTTQHPDSFNDALDLSKPYPFGFSSSQNEHSWALWWIEMAYHLHLQSQLQSSATIEDANDSASRFIILLMLSHLHFSLQEPHHLFNFYIIIPLENSHDDYLPVT